MYVLYINYLFDKKYSSVGAAVHVEEFVRAANANGARVKAVHMNKFNSEEAAVSSKTRAWLKKKLSRHVGQVNALISNVGYFRREWKLISAEKPDALLVRYNLLNVSTVLIARIKKIPLVLEVNSPMALENRQFNKKSVSLPWIPERFERINLNFSDRVFTVSNALKNHFVNQGISSKKISVIPNGVDVNSFSPETDDTEVRKQYSLGKSLVIGFVGSFHYWHGVEQFTTYVGQINQRSSNVKFLFVGDGPMKAVLEEDFKKQGLSDKVVFTGYVEHAQMPAHVAAMDIVLAPYPPMTFFYFSPLKLFEYMAAAKPVVASRVGQIGEMIEDGVNGCLYEPGQIEELVTRTAELIENAKLRKKIGTNARETMIRNYSWKVNAERVVKLLQQSMNGSY